MSKTIIIKFWDNENYDYPLIEIKSNSYKKFKSLLAKYKKENEDTYNNEDFYNILNKQDYFIRLIFCDKEVFF